MVQIANLGSSNFWKHLGMKAIVDTDGETYVQLEVNENLLQFYGNVHGGVLASLMDTAIAVAINQQIAPDQGATTVELKINYLRPVNSGILKGKGTIVQKGKRLVVAQGEIRNEANKIIAIGSATFMIYPLEPKE